MSNAVGVFFSKALSQYKNAENLGRVQVGSQNPLQNGIGHLPDTHEGGASFKNELHAINQAVVKPMKQHGAFTEKALKDQILGIGDTEHTAVALQQLNEKLEIVAQTVRILNEGVKELTKGTMGG